MKKLTGKGLHGDEPIAIDPDTGFIDSIENIERKRGGPLRNKRKSKTKEKEKLNMVPVSSNENCRCPGCGFVFMCVVFSASPTVVYTRHYSRSGSEV